MCLCTTALGYSPGCTSTEGWGAALSAQLVTEHSTATEGFAPSHHPLCL